MDIEKLMLPIAEFTEYGEVCFAHLSENGERKETLKMKQLFDYIQEIEALIAEEKPPECIHKNTCKKCAYYEYCYI